MSEVFPNWLTKRMIRGINGFNLDAYLLALEGWRRGLSLTWYLDPSQVTELKIIGFNPLGKSFSLRSPETNTIHYFYRSRGDKVANEAVDIAHHKKKTKEYLEKDQVPTPKGIQFHKDLANEKVLELIQDLSYPLVVKPVFGSLGKGVITDIKNEVELIQSLDIVRENEEYDEFIVEEFVEGEEFRVYVVNNQVVAATKKVTANIIGDGKSTVEQLIENKNKLRKENPYLKNKLITIDDAVIHFLAEKDLKLETTPEVGQRVFLRSKSNITSGGDPIDVTESIDETIQQCAVSALRAIPNLTHAGIDIIYDGNNPYVIEVNATAGTLMHQFPLSGSPRNVPASIIDFYFPESKDSGSKHPLMYFDYKEIRKLLRDKLAQEVSLTIAPKGQLHTARYVVDGKVQKVGYRAWIRKQALKYGLHGYTRNLKNGRVVVIVASDDEKAVQAFKEVCAKGPSKAEVTKVRQLKWTSPIKLGFEIRKTR